MNINKDLNFFITVVLSLSFYLVPVITNAQVPNSFTISGSGCIRWTPTPATEVNFFIPSNVTDFAAERRIFGTSQWTRIIANANNLPPGGNPIRLTITGDLDDYTVSANNTYEYRIVAINSFGETYSTNTAVVPVNQQKCSPPPALTCSPSSQTVFINGIAQLSASGGTGAYSWSAPNGNPSTGGGSAFSVSYNIGGNYTVRVNSGTDSTPCTVVVSGSAPTPTPTPTSGPPPPPADTTPPRVTNVRVINITQTGGTVLWDTNEPADSQVEYCPTASHCGTNTSISGGGATNHSVNLVGLTPNNFYYVWAKSRDSAGNLGIQGYYLFRTLNAPTPTPIPTTTISPAPTQTSTPIPTSGIPPVISNIQTSNLTRDSITVSWNTDVPATSEITSCFIFFCFSNIYSDSNLSTSHTFTMTGLKADKNYYIQLVGTDINGNQGVSSIVVFRTLPGLIISNIRVINTTQTSLTIGWDTNYPSNSGIITCVAIFFCFFSAPTVDPNITISHTMTVNNLRSNAGYYYNVVSFDPAGYTARSSYNYARTLP